MKKRIVLDAWAILALIQREEPAAARVRALLEEADRGDLQLFISIINLGEVVYRVGKIRGEIDAFETLNQVGRLPVDILPATEDAVFAAARFKMHYPISYADAFAAAAAESLDATLVTGDPELIALKGRIQIEELARSA